MTATMTSDQALRTVTITEKGWHPDPYGQHDLRFHDGTQWTEHVTHFGPVPCQGCSQARA